VPGLLVLKSCYNRCSGNRPGPRLDRSGGAVFGRGRTGRALLNYQSGSGSRAERCQRPHGRDGKCGPVTINAIGLTPESAKSKIRWQIERNPEDTIDNADPDFADNENGRFTVTPNRPGNFRVVAYVNTYDNSTRYKNAELKVLRLAIVRITPRPADSFISVPNLSYTDSVQGENFLLLLSSDAMKIQANVIVEGGGNNRMVGVDQVQLAFAGNALADDVVITYGVPSPTPPAPANVEGIGREGQGLSFPLVDCNAPFPTTADPALHDDKFTRRYSETATLGAGTSGGQVIVVEAWDDPGLGFANRHPTTTNLWTRMQGGIVRR